MILHWVAFITIDGLLVSYNDYITAFPDSSKPTSPGSIQYDVCFVRCGNSLGDYRTLDLLNMGLSTHKLSGTIPGITQVRICTLQRGNDCGYHRDIVVYLFQH